MKLGQTVKQSQQSPMSYCVLKCPVGDLLIVGDECGLKILNFQDGPHPLTPSPNWKEDRPFFHNVIQQLDAYFEGRLSRFRVKLALEGTPFQQKVWKALRKVPFGNTASYGEVARWIGNPNAARAVGAANAKNPLSIIVPCHRVIGQTGALVGYGGGLAIKELLLAHERLCSILLQRRSKTSLRKGPTPQF